MTTEIVDWIQVFTMVINTNDMKMIQGNNWKFLGTDGLQFSFERADIPEELLRHSNRDTE